MIQRNRAAQGRRVAAHGEPEAHLLARDLLQRDAAHQRHAFQVVERRGVGIEIGDAADLDDDAAERGRRSRRTLSQTYPP